MTMSDVVTRTPFQGSAADKCTTVTRAALGDAE